MPLYVVPGCVVSREGLSRSFADGGYLPTCGCFLLYTVEEWPVRLIGLDTQVPGQPGGRLCAERLAWLDARLREAAARLTLVFMHHPPVVTRLQAIDALGLQGKDELAPVIRPHPPAARPLCR